MHQVVHECACTYIDKWISFRGCDPLHPAPPPKKRTHLQQLSLSSKMCTSVNLRYNMK